jgi:hypothetical protein
MVAYTFVARLARMNPKLMIAVPERHMRVMSHPFEMSTPTKTLPLHVRPPPIVPMREAIAY